MRNSPKSEERILPTAQGNIHYLLVQSPRRKSMMIHIKGTEHPAFSPGNGLLVRVLVPSFAQERHIQDFLKENERWIVNQVQRARQNRLKFKPLKFNEGEEFLFLGNKYPLETTKVNNAQLPVRFNGEKWIIPVSEAASAGAIPDDLKDKMIAWYRSQAQEILGGRVFHFARVMGVEPVHIGIRAQKRIWGSCHYRKKAIYLNWKIILAPLPVVDYVVVHELSHLKVPDHSKKFWRQVEKICPDYRQQSRWLKDNHRDMEFA